MTALSIQLPTSPQNPIDWGVHQGCKDIINIAQAVQQSKRLIVIVCCDTQAAMRLERELPFFLSKNKTVTYFPDWEVLPYDTFSPLAEIVSERLQTLYKLQAVQQGALIITASTLLQRLAPRQQILSQCFSLNLGDRLDLGQTQAHLESLGYQHVPSVQAHSEFSVRGSIIDLFPMGSKTPFRIDLLDDDVDSIRTFDTESQRSLEKVENISLFPAREFPINDTSIQLFRQQFRQHFPDAPHSTSLYQQVSKGIMPNGIEHYMPLFVETTESFFDYLEDATLILHGDIHQAAEDYSQQIVERYLPRKGDIDRPPLTPESLFIDTNTLKQQLNAFSRIQLTHKLNSNAPTALIEPAIKPEQQKLSALVAQPSHRTLFIAESPGHRESMLLQLKKLAIKPTLIEHWDDFHQATASTCITVASIDEGLLLDDLSIITESMLFGNKAQQRRRRRTSHSKQLENVFNSLADLEIGSPVVHQEHGVGRYLGLKHIDVDNIETEFLTLEYANDDKLYVPVSSLNLIGRYMGSQGDTAPLHKLGSDQWQKARKKALQKARDVAAELLDIHARRAARGGKAMVIESTEYDTFANAFPFEETIDQATAIEQTLNDQSLAKPMDRVVCGDVGFGKTEVAMRAAFIATHNNHQVALLVPTTLLAQQHYQNFSDRFADWPIRVEVLSRFVTAKEQKKIIEDTADGKVDILIGTHKLLQKSVQYKNLGLVIIDEEQRFGVRHKEYFKSMRSEVDMLTLTATPIPRTLNQAMSGLRDISIIASPPPSRHAIETFVSEWNNALIQEACEREIRRGGQIFFLHNDIDTMDRVIEDIKKIVPDASPRKAHGQMRESELEQIMFDFYHHRFNVLVSTTIIENGIDLPNANTILINRADKLGLSQLHQLRGRVGRSHHRAYAYMLIPPEGVMTNDAKKRIAAIESSTDLGAGFSLSTHDMEIRGAGELLGDNQSGEIQEIGFTMYTDLLEKAVDALKSGNQPELDVQIDAGPSIELYCSALIPDDYLPDVHTRLILYKRIASADNAEQLRELQVEMIDRFGLLPDATKQLFNISELKQVALALGIDTIDYGKTHGRIQFTDNPSINPAKIIELIQTQPQVYQLDGPQKLRFTKKLDTIEDKTDFLFSLLNELKQTNN